MNHYHWILRVFLVAVLVLSAGCGSSPSRSAAGEPSRSPVLAHVSSTGGVANDKVSASKASADIKLPDYVVQRRYDDVFRENDQDIPVTVEYGWDYRSGVGIERVYDRGTSTLRSQRRLPGQTLTFSDLEIELAFALAREAPELAVALSEPNLHFNAGFAYYESKDPACFRGSRCVHVIVGGGIDSERTVAHAIVDLMSRKVVHPFFAPDVSNAANRQ